MTANFTCSDSTCSDIAVRALKQEIKLVDLMDLKFTTVRWLFDLDFIDSNSLPYSTSEGFMEPHSGNFREYYENEWLTWYLYTF